MIVTVQLFRNYFCSFFFYFLLLVLKKKPWKSQIDSNHSFSDDDSCSTLFRAHCKLMWRQRVTADLVLFATKRSLSPFFLFNFFFGGSTATLEICSFSSPLSLSLSLLLSLALCLSLSVFRLLPPSHGCFDSKQSPNKMWNFFLLICNVWRNHSSRFHLKEKKDMWKPTFISTLSTKVLLELNTC